MSEQHPGRGVAAPYRTAGFDDLACVDLEGLQWRPIRRTLGVTAFGINAYTAAGAGDPLIEPHDERSPGAGGHEELYLVLRGRATFVIGDAEAIDAPAGTLILVEPGVQRSAVASEEGTAVVVVGSRSGAALPVSPYEHWYAAQPAFQAGDYDRAVEIASAGLEDWPEHGQIHYHLACFHAMAGRTDTALHHLHLAIANEPRAASWAADDSDLDAIREHPDWPA